MWLYEADVQLLITNKAFEQKTLYFNTKFKYGNAKMYPP